MTTGEAPSARPPKLSAARTAGLHWVDDSKPGIRRDGVPGAFRYLATDGEVITDPETLDRIRRLVIPPAWTDVWIFPLADGHIQATGRDARRRKQYRYHARWREVRDEQKYARVIDFGTALPRIRASAHGSRPISRIGHCRTRGACGGDATARPHAHPRR